MNKSSKQTGAYEVGSLIVGAVIAGWSLWEDQAIAGGATSCLSIGGVCVPFVLLSLICLEVVGILTATIISTVKQTEHAARWLPHALYVIGATVIVSIAVRLSV
jgi:hypothetical protein